MENALYVHCLSFCFLYRVGTSGEEHNLSDNVPLILRSRLSGELKVEVNLKGSEKKSPVLYSGVQIVLGNLLESADYVTRSVPAGIDTQVWSYAKKSSFFIMMVTAQVKAFGNKFAANISAVISGHVDIAQIIFMEEKPTQVMVGNGGSSLYSQDQKSTLCGTEPEFISASWVLCYVFCEHLWVNFVNKSHIFLPL